MSGYSTIPATEPKPAREIAKGDVLFLAGAGTRVVASDPWVSLGYVVFETTWIDGQHVGRWQVRAASTVLVEQS
jgi:hypothetical protein